MEKEQVVTLVEYNTWANHKVIDKAAHLTSAELLAEASLSHHSIAMCRLGSISWIHNGTGGRRRTASCWTLSSDCLRLA